MNIALIILGALLAFATLSSGLAKIAKVPAVMASMASVGVRREQIPILAALEIAGGFGLILGIWNKQLGTLSAICISLYFLGALISHLRKKHGVSEFGAAFFLLIVSVGTTILQLKR